MRRRLPPGKAAPLSFGVDLLAATYGARALDSASGKWRWSSIMRPRKPPKPKRPSGCGSQSLPCPLGWRPVKQAPVEVEPEEDASMTEFSFWTGLQWDPIVVAFFAFYLWMTTYLDDFPIGRTAAACFASVWFLGALFDCFSGHKLLERMAEGDPGEEDDE